MLSKTVKEAVSILIGLLASFMYWYVSGLIWAKRMVVRGPATHSIWPMIVWSGLAFFAFYKITRLLLAKVRS